MPNDQPGRVQGSGIACGMIWGIHVTAPVEPFLAAEQPPSVIKRLKATQSRRPHTAHELPFCEVLRTRKLPPWLRSFR